MPDCHQDPSLVISDLCTLRPESESDGLVVDSPHPGVIRGRVIDATNARSGLPKPFGETPPLRILRTLHHATSEAHLGAA